MSGKSHFPMDGDELTNEKTPPLKEISGVLDLVISLLVLTVGCYSEVQRTHQLTHLRLLRTRN